MDDLIGPRVRGVDGKSRFFLVGYVGCSKVLQAIGLRPFIERTETAR